MTCIVGIEGKGGVILGGDSCGSDGWGSRIISEPKVFENGAFVFGYTSSFRFGQLLQYAFQPPEQKGSQSVEQYMHTEFMDALRKCLKDGGYARNDSGEESGGVALVGYRGRLFELQADFSLLTPHRGCAAVGSGILGALGALHATKDKPAKRRAEMALEAAEDLVATVRGPFHFVEQKAA